MIITKLEIEQFGGLKNYELSLVPGAQYLYGENEAGKSTLCAFICAMFYGLSKVRGAGLKGDMRSLYMPWGENYMAGSLHFSAEGTDYVLERRFGETARGDKCKLYLASDWTEVPISKDEIGTKFLGVGEDAFRKTLFISQLGAAFSKGKEDELLTRLSNLEQTGEEDASLQKAILALESAQHELISKTGRGGEIPKLDGEMEALRNELFEAKEKNRSFRYLLEEIRTLTSDRDQGEKALADLDAKRKTAAAFEETEKRKLAQKHITEKKERLKKEQESFDGVCKELSTLELEKESYQKVLALEEGIVTKLAQKETTLLMLGKQQARKEQLLSEIKTIEEELAAGKAPKKKGTWTQILAIALSTLGIFLGIFLSPVCFILLSGLALLFLPKKDTAYEKERLQKEAKLNEKKEILRELSGEETEEYVEKLKKELSAVFSQTETESLSALSEKIQKGRDLARQIESLCREKSRLEESIRVLSEELSGIEEVEELEAISYDGPTLSELDREREQLLSLQVEREKLLAQKNAKAENGFSGTRGVSLIESEIAQKAEHRKELYEQYEAITLAKEALTDCAEDLKQNFAPALNEKSGKLIARLTNGRYFEAKVTDDYQMKLRSKERSEIISADYVSAGTYDLVYFALRLSVLKTLYETIPLLCMDDTFLQLDTFRQETAFSCLLAEEAEQILYFSCHEPPALWPEDKIIKVKHKEEQ